MVVEKVGQAVSKARELVGGGTPSTGVRSLPVQGTPAELERLWHDATVRDAVTDGLELEPASVHLRFAEGRPDWGATVTANVEFPGPVPELGADALAGKLVRRFKALAETGEMPTTAHNPSGRNDGAGR